MNKKHDPVYSPNWYTNHPSGVECIDIVEHMNFCLGNAVKYIWRASLKGKQLEDLKKAQFYINREVVRLENETLKEIPEGGIEPNKLVETFHKMNKKMEQKKVVDKIGEELTQDISDEELAGFPV